MRTEWDYNLNVAIQHFDNDHHPGSVVDDDANITSTTLGPPVGFNNLGDLNTGNFRSHDSWTDPCRRRALKTRMEYTEIACPGAAVVR